MEMGDRQKVLFFPQFPHLFKPLLRSEHVTIEEKDKYKYIAQRYCNYLYVEALALIPWNSERKQVERAGVVVMGEITFLGPWISQVIVDQLQL